MVDATTPHRSHLRILGTRGIPAQHGGFETFAEYLASYMAQHGWQVTVYCQEEGVGPLREDRWQGIRRVIIPVTQAGAKGTVIFDWKAMRHASKERGAILTLGYNTAIFSVPYRFKRIPHLMNMDGIEWKRAKWSPMERLWLYLNEWAGCYLANHLIADHPEIEKHLTAKVSRKKITMIPYGSEALHENPPPPYKGLPIESGKYALVIARPEPENSILEIVKAFAKKRRGYHLLVLGHYQDQIPYHAEIKSAASHEVLFPGAIYDRSTVQSLRYHCAVYIHGHTVGGTNPSLVESMGAGKPILAHDNAFNRWVAGPGASYFTTAEHLESFFSTFRVPNADLRHVNDEIAKRHESLFLWERVLRDYHGSLVDLADQYSGSIG